MATDSGTTIELAICIRNEDYGASLELRKLYQLVPDAEAAGLGQLRVIDESREDYLYPEHYFVRVQLPGPVEQAVIEAA